MKKLSVGSCFSGIGGLELGLEWTGGFETKWQIENDPYATKVLEKHWPNVKRYADIRDVSFPDRVDLVCGGFPCQDVSIAGKRKGLEGKRSTLWGEMFRLVRETKPTWVMAENVPGLLSSDDGRFFGNILRDLANGGYHVEWQMFSAAGVGAPHLRQRLFIISHSDCIRNGQQSFKGRQTWGQPYSLSSNVSNSNGYACPQSLFTGYSKKKINENSKKIGGKNRFKSQMGHALHGRISGIEEWLPEPQIPRMVNGLSSELDEIKCLGNAVVPQVAQKIGEMILEYERGFTVGV